jgi:two-component system sensor histidine kinase KdpD
LSTSWRTQCARSSPPKRWQDVEELLEAGINVYTPSTSSTWRSLNDVIQELRASTRETVPDEIFDERIPWKSSTTAR